MDTTRPGWFLGQRALGVVELPFGVVPGRRIPSAGGGEGDLNRLHSLYWIVIGSALGKVVRKIGKVGISAVMPVA
ncbi:MAG: hypothetical protein ACI91B_004147 [Planctomycetota bacterium]|jgi:hypothetical protein